MEIKQIADKVWRNKGKLAAGAVIIAGGAKGGELYNGAMNRVDGLERRVRQEDALVKKLVGEDVLSTKLNCAVVDVLTSTFDNCDDAAAMQQKYWQNVIKDIQNGGDGNIEGKPPTQTQ